MYLIFSEFKYIDRLQKWNLDKEYFKLDVELILAILLIDNSDNHEYFCHKYKTPNSIKDKLYFLGKSFKQINLEKNYFKKDLKKNSYLIGKNNLKDLNKLNYFIDDQITIKQYLQIDENINNILIPRFPFNGKFLIDQGFKEGKKIGLAIDKLEKEWIESNYTLSEKTALEILNKIK